MEVVEARYSALQCSTQRGLGSRGATAVDGWDAGGAVIELAADGGDGEAGGGARSAHEAINERASTGTNRVAFARALPSRINAIPIGSSRNGTPKLLRSGQS